VACRSSARRSVQTIGAYGIAKGRERG